MRLVGKTLAASPYRKRLRGTTPPWVRRYIRFYGVRHVLRLRLQHVRAFLGMLDVMQGIPPAHREEALDALVFFHADVLGQTVPPEAWRACWSVAQHRDGARFDTRRRSATKALGPSVHVAAHTVLLAGLAPVEALALRVGDVDLSAAELRVQAPEADYVVLLPEALRPTLHSHVRLVRMLYERDQAQGLAGVPLPPGTGDPGDTSTAWAWQFVFPARAPTPDPTTGHLRRGPTRLDSLAPLLAPLLDRTLTAATAAVNTHPTG
jgi:integrase